MANNYTIDFTDQNANRSFQLNAYTTNGPENPTTDTLDGKAASAATSLLLHGKGSPNYGERIQEDIIHLLENFAGDIEPAYPIGGQVWYDRSTTPYVLRVFNTRKHLITVNAPPNSTALNYVTIADDQTVRLSAGTRIRVVNADGAGLVKDDQDEFLISTSVLDVNSNTAIDILPVPISTLVGSYIGGWEYIIQNDTGLYEDLPANGFKITGLGTPTNTSDASTKGYVDSQILSNNELGELTDVTITAVATGQVLIYDGTVWRNATGSASGFLPLSGGGMVGQIDMGGNLIRSLANPIAAQDAATKNYVDITTATTAALIPSIISDMNDVVYGGPLAADDVLVFDGGIWTNIDKATHISNLGVLLTIGGTMIGDLFLSSNPTTNLQAATKSYVDTELAAAISASGDGVVNGGFFDNLNQELTLTRTNGLPSVVVTGFAAGGTISTAVFHQIAQPTTLSGMLDLYWEHSMYVNPAYPNISLDQLLTELNKTIGNMIFKPHRIIVPATGGTEYDVGNDITGTFGDLAFDYVPGYSNLNVSVNGVKQYADQPGFLEVNATLGTINPITDTDQLWPGMPTGLNPAITYAFQIRLNSAVASDSGLITILVVGADAQNLGGLVDAIHLSADTQLNNFSGQSGDSIPPFGVLLSDGIITFYSAFPGLGSSVTLTDGNGGTNTALFASIVGGTDAGGRTYTYTIPTASINAGKKNDGVGTNPPVPDTWGYREVGRTGRASTKFVFTAGSEPPINTPVEILITNVPLYDRTPQP